MGIVLAYAVFRYGAVLDADLGACLAGTGVVIVWHWFRTPSGQMAPKFDPWVRWSLVLLPAYAVLQCLPLPMQVLRVVSPARAAIAEMIRSVGLGGRFAPLTVNPAATLVQALRVLGIVALFLLAREMMWLYSERVWVPAMPLMLIGTAEALYGLSVPATQTGPSGTFVNHNHFAGFLAMSLPFVLMWAAAVQGRGRQRGRSPMGPALKTSGLLIAGATIFIAIVLSESRMGFTACLASLCVLCALAFGARVPGWWKVLGGAGSIAALVLGFLFLPQDSLIHRFASVYLAEFGTGDVRFPIWRDTLNLIAAYPLFGCGLGGYESAFLKYKTSSLFFKVDYAHSDYLQLTAELGCVGMAILAFLAAVLLFRAVRGSMILASPDARLLAAACAASFTVILLHSLTDFNLYIPSNAMVVAWVGGIVTGLNFVEPRRRDQVPKVIDLTHVEMA
jgi:O-antigen ligase